MSDIFFFFLPLCFPSKLLSSRFPSLLPTGEARRSIRECFLARFFLNFFSSPPKKANAMNLLKGVPKIVRFGFCPGPEFRFFSANGVLGLSFGHAIASIEDLQKN